MRLYERRRGRWRDHGAGGEGCVGVDGCILMFVFLRASMAATWFTGGLSGSVSVSNRNKSTLVGAVN